MAARSVPKSAAAASCRLIEALGPVMNEDVLNMSVRKFLKKVGVTSQREIEEAARAAVGSGKLKGNETLPAKVTLTVAGIDLAVDIEGAVELE